MLDVLILGHLENMQWMYSCISAFNCHMNMKHIAFTAESACSLSGDAGVCVCVEYKSLRAYQLVTSF